METQFLSMKMHIGYLRSLEESARVRAACIAYLQRYLIYFYPEHQALMREAQELAAALGGKLENPRLPTKYQWIQKLFGWEFGKRIWVLLPKMKESLKQQCDKALFQIEARKLTKQSRQGAVSRSPA
jgi:hypothetical protein